MGLIISRQAVKKQAIELLMEHYRQKYPRRYRIARRLGFVLQLHIEPMEGNKKVLTEIYIVTFKFVWPRIYTEGRCEKSA